MEGREVRAFKRWMRDSGIEHKSVQGIRVRALDDLNKGDIIATIPKITCLRPGFTTTNK